MNGYQKESRHRTGTDHHGPGGNPKERVLTFRRYADRRDLLSVLLEDGKEYTFDQIDGLINDFMKGKVN